MARHTRLGRLRFPGIDGQADNFGLGQIRQYWQTAGAIALFGLALSAPSADAGPTVGQSEVRVTPWQMGAKFGDCVSDNSAALEAAARVAVATKNGVLWTGGSCLAFGRSWRPPAGLVWRSDFLDIHRLIWIGQQDQSPIEGTGAIDLDGVVLDLGRPRGASRTGSASTQRVVGFGLHGAMQTDHPAYLDGVRIGRLRVANGQAAAAVALVNLRGARIDHIEVNSNWGQGVNLAGLRDSVVSTLACNDIGNLGTQANRAGQCAAIFAEADPGKTPAAWYTIAGRGNSLASSQPCRNVLPTDGLNIGLIKTWGNTDTAVYIHDYGPDDRAGFGAGGRPETCSGPATPLGWGTGQSHIQISRIEAEYQGKDAFKARRWVQDISVGALIVRRSGGRIFACEVWCQRFSIGEVSAQADSPFDVVAALLGRPAGSMLFSNDQVKGSTTYNGLNQTLSTVAVGGYISQAREVHIGGGKIVGVGGLSYAPSQQGYCVQIADSQDVRVRMACDKTAGPAIRMSNVRRFSLDIDAKDACRNQTDRPCYAIHLGNDGPGANRDGTVRWSASDSTQSKRMAAPVFVAPESAGLRLIGTAQPGDFRLGKLIDMRSSAGNNQIIAK